MCQFIVTPFAFLNCSGTFSCCLQWRTKLNSEQKRVCFSKEIFWFSLKRDLRRGKLRCVHSSLAVNTELGWKTKRLTAWLLSLRLKLFFAVQWHMRKKTWNKTLFLLVCQQHGTRKYPPGDSASPRFTKRENKHVELFVNRKRLTFHVVLTETRKKSSCCCHHVCTHAYCIRKNENLCSCAVEGGKAQNTQLSFCSLVVWSECYCTVVKFLSHEHPLLIFPVM